MEPFSYRSAAVKGRQVEFVDPEIARLVKLIIDYNFKLIVIRGISGSGKSYLAKQLKDALPSEAVICEADAFMGPKFNANRLNDCHRKCQELAQNSLQKGKIAIVSNTSSTQDEVDTYKLIALDQHVNIKIMEPLTSWKYDIDKCMRMSTHKVPQHIFEKHLNNIQMYPTSELQ